MRRALAMILLLATAGCSDEEAASGSAETTTQTEAADASDGPVRDEAAPALGVAGAEGSGEREMTRVEETPPLRGGDGHRASG